MEIKKQKIIITSHNKSFLYLPVKWLSELDINKDNREVYVTFKDNKIIIEKAE